MLGCSTVLRRQLIGLISTNWQPWARGIQVRGKERFIDNGLVITAAGVSAGIDMALHLVARLQSPGRERAVRRYIQYDPQPPISSA